MTVPRPDPLPSFGRAPVMEVALSIQFAELTEFKAIHGGLLFHELRGDYPNAADQAALPPVFESFDAGGPMDAGFRLDVFGGQPPPRFWFTTADENFLLQVQRDRLILNWRKRRKEDIYPRYPDLRARLMREIERVGGVLAREKLPGLAPNQCEVTYVNGIRGADGVNPHAHPDRVVTLWSPRPVSGDDARAFEGAALNAKFLMLHEGGEPYGRVHVNVVPMLAPPRSGEGALEPALQMEVTARARPGAATVSSALECLDKAREAVVRTFAEVTTPEMHELWGRNDVTS